MKVLNIGKYNPKEFRGGIEKESARLTNQIADEIEVYSLYYSRNSSLLARSFTQVKISRLLGKIEWGFRYVICSFKLMKSYDVIWLHYPNVAPALVLFFLRLRSNQRLIVHWHNDILIFPSVYKWYKKIERVLLSKADKIIVTSPNYSNGSEALIKYSDKIVVCNLCIRDRGEGIVIREKPSIVRMLAVGRYSAYKGFENLITYVLERDDVHLDLVTNSDLPKSLEKKINTTDRIKLHLNISDGDLINLYQTCSVYMFSSVTRNEGFGLVLLEALSYGLPVIANKLEHSGSEYVMSFGSFGITLDLRNFDEVDQALEEIFLDDNTYAERQKSAREVFEKNFNSHSDNSFLKVLASLNV